MQRATRNRNQAGRIAEHRAVQTRQRRTSHTAVSLPSTDVLTLAPASVLSLPTLAGAPLSYAYREDSSILLPVAEYMAKHGHATDADWRGDITGFVHTGIERIIAATGIDEHTIDAPTLHTTLADHEGYYSRSDELGKKLRLGIGAQECGWMRMAPITRKLERTAPGLGAAFYAAVIDALESVGWAFDYSRAEWDCSSHKEMIEDENGKSWAEMTAEERKQYEFDDPAKDLPGYLNEVKHGHATAAHRALLDAHRRKHPKPISLALKLVEYTDALRKLGVERPEGDSPANYLVHFRDHDAITNWFDEWSQHFLEGDVTYLWQRTFDPAKPAEVKKAFTAFETAMRLLAAAAELAPIVNGVKR